MGRHILCYGDSNTWGCIPVAALDGPFGRYGADQRWTGVLRRALGPDVTVSEEGLNGRTTVYDDPVLGADRNGRTYLEPCLQSHMPLDLVIVMLGTNDLKPRFSANAFDIASGAGVLLNMIRQRPPSWVGPVPERLLIAPPHLGEMSALKEMFEGGADPSTELALRMEKIAAATGTHFLNAADHITVSPVDGVHLEAEAHQRLGEVVAEKTREIVDSVN